MSRTLDFVGRVRRAVEREGGRYAIEREVGRGGMATVFLARDLRHDRPVAVKVLHPNLIASASAERFLREIRIAAALAHPNILPLHDSGETDGLLFYVMPYVEEETLRLRLAREGALPVADALRIAREVAGALAHAHERGIVHRDVKPENVLLLAGHAVVADFGVARAVHRAQEAPITSDGLVIGTPAYASPEQAAGAADVDGRSDVYALGCVLFELLAGVPPFAAPTPQVVLALQRTAPPPPLGAYRAGLPPSVERVVARALAKSPADRFPTAQALADALADALGEAIRDTIADTTPIPPPNDTPVVPPPAHDGGRRPVARAGFLAALAAVAALWLLLGRRREAPPGEVWLVVAPFGVVGGDSSLRMWGEGVVDALSFNLTDVGALRAVQPSMADAYWPDRVDAASAAELARRTGARFVAYGALAAAGSGPDSVRLTASLLEVDADSARTLRELRWDAPVAELPHLTDSLTQHVLAAIGARVRLGAVRGTWLGALTSSVALREYLRGEQAYRRSDWGPAIEHYQRALDADSTFAPALRRVAAALGWQGTDADSLVIAYRMRAAAHAGKLPARESLLVVVDSLRGAVTRAADDTTTPAAVYWRLARRLFATLREGTRRWPDDPEVWYGLADAQYHYAVGPLAVAPERILAGFDRAIALDSGFAPSYVHPVELGFMLGGDALGLRYAERYLALRGEGITVEGVRLLVALVGARDGARDGVDVARRLAGVSPDTLLAAANTLDRWTDAGETTVELARRADVRRRGAPAGCDAPYPHWATRLAYRGHLAMAWCRLGAAARRTSPLAADRALLDAMPADSAAALFARWLAEEGGGPASAALPWWARRGDTLSIHRLRALAAERVEASERARYDVAAADAYLALARRDTTEALRRLAALPDTLCRSCFGRDRLTRARLLAARGRDAEARTILAGWLGPQVSPLEIEMALERARVADRLGDRAGAVRAYRTVARAWGAADPPLRALAREAAARAAEDR